MSRYRVPKTPFSIIRKIADLLAILLVAELWRELLLPGNAVFGWLLLAGCGLLAFFVLRDIFALARQRRVPATEPQPSERLRLARYASNLLVFTHWMILLALVGFSCYLGHLTIHPAHRPAQADHTPGKYGIPYQDVTLTTPDGISLQAWYTPPQNGVVILAAHGFGDTRSPEIYALFARHGYGVLAWDFRAQGQSGGNTVTLGYLEWRDVIAALDFARNQPGVERIGAWGNSMGGAAVIQTAAQNEDIRAIVIDSAYASMTELLNTNVTIPMMRWPMRWYTEWQTGMKLAQARPVDWIGQISPRPVFLIGDPVDGMVGDGAIDRLYAAAKEPRQVWYTPGVGHNGMFRAEPQAYEDRLIQFFDTTLLAQETSQNASEK